jgi:hypothetical protein
VSAAKIAGGRMAEAKPAPTPQTSAVGAELVAKLVAATPFALASLAVLYDAGYFARIGLDFFPLFSLTEHIMFGMEGIPYLLIFLVLLYFMIAVGSFRRRTPAELGAVAVGLAIGGVVWLVLYPGAWPSAALGFVAALMVGLWTFVEGQRKALAIVAGNLVVWLLTAFTWGYWIAAGVLNLGDAPLWLRWSPVPTLTISLSDGPPLIGRVLRSGEQGLLVFNAPDGSIQFKRWDDVRGIDLPPAKAR